MWKKDLNFLTRLNTLTLLTTSLSAWLASRSWAAATAAALAAARSRPCELRTGVVGQPDERKEDASKAIWLAMVLILI